MIYANFKKTPSIVAGVLGILTVLCYLFEIFIYPKMVMYPMRIVLSVVSYTLVLAISISMIIKKRNDNVFLISMIALSVVSSIMMLVGSMPFSFHGYFYFIIPNEANNIIYYVESFLPSILLLICVLSSLKRPLKKSLFWTYSGVYIAFLLTIVIICCIGPFKVETSHLKSFPVVSSFAFTYQAIPYALFQIITAYCLLTQNTINSVDHQ